jgi:malate dehydrogenase
VHDWAIGTPEGDWTSMAVFSEGWYGAPEGVFSSFPVTAGDWAYSVVEGLEVNDFSRGLIDRSNAELVAERDSVRELGLLP